MLPAPYTITFRQGATYEKEFQVLDTTGTAIDLSLYTSVQLCQFRDKVKNNGGVVLFSGTITLTDPVNGKFKVTVSKAVSNGYGTAAANGTDEYVAGVYDVQLAKADGTALIPIAGPWQMYFDVSQ